MKYYHMWQLLFPKQRSQILVKSLLIMKLTILIVLLATLNAVSMGVAQTVNLELKNASLESAFTSIKKQTGYSFIYKESSLEKATKVNLHIKNKPLESALSELLENQPLDYQLHNGTIVIRAKADLPKSTVLVNPAQQQRELTGKVTDAEGSPLAGVTVAIKGTSVITSTNASGDFTINAPSEGGVLLFSIIGYSTQEVSIGDRAVVNVVLEAELADLDEVVVVGYGTQRKADVTGSITTVSGDQMAKLPTVGASEALQGMAAGLSINMDSGAPGSSASMMVRGVTTWGSSNDPLVIIDGVPGDMSYINPEDIKTISVLKDAALASIYGSRSAAGVILVETHRGVNSEPKIEFSTYHGIDDLPKRMDVANSAEYIEINKMALKNAGIAENRWPQYIAAYESDPSQFADTDWQNEYYRRGSKKKYNLGYRAGSEHANIAFSGFYSSTKGIVTGTNADKYGVRINSDVTRGKFKFGESINYGHTTEKPEAETGFPGMFQTTNIQPLIHVYNPDNEGGYGGAIAGLGMTDAANPVAFNNLIDTRNSNDNFAASGYIQYNPMDELTFRFRAGRTQNYWHYKSFVPTYYVGANSVNTISRLNEHRGKTTEDILELTGNFSQTFGDRHHFEALLGISQEEMRYDDQLGAVSNFENNDMRYLTHGQTDAAVDGGFNRNALRSAFGRINYNYDYRYMLMFSSRYDGSSRFGAGNKWGFFPSVSAGWNVANEDFWVDMKGDIPTLKLRLSYGALGNQSIGNYMFIPRLAYNNTTLNYPMGGQDINIGYAVDALPSSYIKWETTSYKNIGVDIGLFQNALELTLEAFTKNTYDMLSSKNISAATGFGALIVNEGKLRTNGIELQARYRGQSHDFKYEIDANISHYKSVLKQMSDPGYLFEDGPARTYVNGEIGEFWVLETQGIFQNQQEVDEWNTQNGSTDEAGNWIPLQPAAKPGDIRFVDQNGDGKLDFYDRVHVGSGNPRLALGFNINLSYKSFDLLANFYGNFGVKRYDYMKRQLERMDLNFNYGRAALNAWTPENPHTDIPRAVIGDPNGNNSVSDRFVANGDYLRLNNLQIGYNLPKEVGNRLGVESMRIYAGATRLFTWTKYKGYDPGTGATVGSMGVDYAIYPLSRTFMLGVKVGI